jgi:hypothetical protein
MNMLEIYHIRRDRQRGLAGERCLVCQAREISTDHRKVGGFRSMSPVI